MTKHPEVNGSLGELIEFVERQETVDVWCKGCEMFRKANSAYAKYLKGEISECRFCREDNV